MGEKAHDHEYKAVKYNVQEAVIKHWDYKDHLMTTLSHEKVKLFCVKCGHVVEPPKLP